jgi:hypothetical protein
MKFYLNEDEKNYSAIVATLKSTFPVPGLDNLVGANFFGATVLLGKEERVGTVGLFFPAETQLSDEFLSNNNLYRHQDLNKNQEKKGFFEDNGRCRTVKFKGNVSSGFWIPITSLDYIGKDLPWTGAGGVVLSIDEGTEFHKVGDHEICRKYVVRGRGKASSNQKKQFKLVDLVDRRIFPDHLDTENLFRNMHKLSLNDHITVTIKMHGTSAHVQNGVVYRQMSWWKKLLRKFVELERFDYRYIVGSRRVIKSIDFKTLDGKLHYYDNDVWSRAAELFQDKLHKYEHVYFEIVGWEGEKPIQKNFTYSIPKGEFEVYVYRIAISNPDGVAQDLPWSLVKKRCVELGVKHVPEVYDGTVQGWLEDHGVVISDWWQFELEKLITEHYLDKDSMFSSSEWKNVEEGICIFKQALGNFTYLKAKSPLFLLQETKALDDGEVSIEDEQVEEEVV